MLIDSHCHVLSSEYDDIDKIIKDVFATDVGKIIINGFDLASSIEAVSIAEKYENVYAAIGIGPENIDSFKNEDIEMFEHLALSSKVVAVGEIGLDYYWTRENEQRQVEVFKLMLMLAKKHKFPVIVHSRKAIEETYNLLKEYNAYGIMHCFSGSLQMADKFIKIGFLIGISGIVTFKNSKKLKEIVESVDLCNLSLETDSPYLTPEPFRGKLNTPSYISFIARKIAEIKGVSYEMVADITSNSVNQKFDL